MRSTLAPALALVAAFLAGFASSAPDSPSAPSTPGHAPRNERPDSSPDDPIVTLWAQDETRASYDFLGGGYGGRIVDGEIHLDNAQIAWHVLEPDKLSIGFVENQSVLVEDLGALTVPSIPGSADRGPKPPLSIYHTLAVERDRFIYRGPVRKTYYQKTAQGVLRKHPQQGVRHFEPLVGHTYVLRFRPNYRDRRREYLVKMQVLDVELGRRLSFRWASL